CVKVKLKDVAFAIPVGHRLRVAISTTYWPMVWPSPRPVRLSICSGTSTLDLPVRKPDPDDQNHREFGSPRASQPVNPTVLRKPNHDWIVTRDLKAEETTITVMKDNGTFILDSTGLEFDHKGIEAYRILDNDPLAASADMRWTVRYRRDDWCVRIENRAVMTSTEDRFLVTANIEAYEGETRVLRRMSRMACSAGSLLLMVFCLIFVPYGHYDQPEKLHYENPSVCPKGADVRHFHIAFGQVEALAEEPIIPFLRAAYAETSRIRHAIEAEGVRSGIL
ncbi:MAG: CocE/NonD family hydrolase C-terminal non-catalytic domain-containing protein, partial [Alphaproteobacteria bacterium]|nr:CocE/NonD family hydrolase C-terminal non-catalytic domain-containing protein [Alphaproteobacteria bacterium]